MSRPRIALAMIAKNERAVIGRCLESVRPWIDAWAVVDTGSTDGTQDVVRAALVGIPGSVRERPWQDFATNRNEALRAAAEELVVAVGQTGAAPGYLLVVDADDWIGADPAMVWPHAMEAEGYELRVEHGETAHHRVHLVQADRAGRPDGPHYEGAIHEALVLPPGARLSRLPGWVYRVGTGGARATDPERFRKDAIALQAELDRRPDHARTAFYLAQSLRDAGDAEAALAAYDRRAAMGEWAEEVAVARYEAARLMAQLGRPEPAVLDAFLAAFGADPARAEPLCAAAAYLRGRDRAAAGYPFALAAAALPEPAGRSLFVDASVYAWRGLDELAVAAYACGRYAESAAASAAILRDPRRCPPADSVDRIAANLAAARGKLGLPLENPEIEAALSRAPAPVDAVPDAGVGCGGAGGDRIGRLERAWQAFAARFGAFERILLAVLRAQGERTMTQFDDLLAEVTATTSAEAAAVKAYDGVLAQLADAQATGNPAALAQAIAQLKAGREAMVAAIFANTSVSGGAAGNASSGSGGGGGGGAGAGGSGGVPGNAGGGSVPGSGADPSVP